MKKMTANKKLDVWVQPGAKQNQIVGEIDGAVKIKIAATPVEGKANKALIAFIAKSVCVKKSDIKIEAGASGRRKIISIEGMDGEKAKRKLLE